MYNSILDQDGGWVCGMDPSAMRASSLGALDVLVGKVGHGAWSEKKEQRSLDSTQTAKQKQLLGGVQAHGALWKFGSAVLSTC